MFSSNNEYKIPCPEEYIESENGWNRRHALLIETLRAPMPTIDRATIERATTSVDEMNTLPETCTDSASECGGLRYFRLSQSGIELGLACYCRASVNAVKSRPRFWGRGPEIE